MFELSVGCSDVEVFLEGNPRIIDHREQQKTSERTGQAAGQAAGQSLARKHFRTGLMAIKFASRMHQVKPSIKLLKAMMNAPPNRSQLPTTLLRSCPKFKNTR